MSNADSHSNLYVPAREVVSAAVISCLSIMGSSMPFLFWLAKVALEGPWHFKHLAGSAKKSKYIGN